MLSSARKSDISYYDKIKEFCLSIASPAPGSVVLVVVVEGHGHLCTNTYYLHDLKCTLLYLKQFLILKRNYFYLCSKYYNFNCCHLVSFLKVKIV